MTMGYHEYRRKVEEQQAKAAAEAYDAEVDKVYHKLLAEDDWRLTVAKLIVNQSRALQRRPCPASEIKYI